MPTAPLKVNRANSPSYRRVEVSSFKNINPQWFLKRTCGFNVVAAKRSIDDISRMSLLQASKISNMGELKASKLIAASRLFAEGLDIRQADMDKIVNKMSVLMLYSEKGALYEDLCTVSSLAGLIAEKMGLSAERVRDLRIAGMLHDIGKAAGEDAQRAVEIASSGLHGKMEAASVTVEQASVKLFSKRERIKPEETIESFVGRVFKSKGEQKAILDALFVGLRLKPKDQIRTFYNLHTYLGTGLLANKIPKNIRRLIALHHVLEKVNPLDENMLGHEYKLDGLEDYDALRSAEAEIARAKNDRMWKDAKILILADKFDAYLRRGEGVTFQQALGFFHTYIRRNNLVQDRGFNEISKALFTLVKEGHPELRDLGIIK